jgi:hypothetical protein
MAREGGAGGWMDWDGARPMDIGASRYFRQDREDRPVFRPLPRPNFRGQPRAPNRQYDRYFSRSAKR